MKDKNFFESDSVVIRYASVDYIGEHVVFGDDDSTPGKKTIDIFLRGGYMISLSGKERNVFLLGFASYRASL